MAEEKSVSEPVSGAADSVALGLAISRSSPAVDGELIDYLRDQRQQLHEQLKQTLAVAGKWNQARAQFARAAALDLTPPEKIELAKARGGG